MATARIESLYLWPVKGFSGERIEEARLQPHKPLAHDRRWAIERSGPVFDAANPRHVPKGKFLQLVNTPQLARLKSRYDPQTTLFQLFEGDPPRAEGRLDTRQGRQAIEDFLHRWLGDLAPARPRVVGAGEHHFFDVPRPWLSIINLASLKELERHTGKPLNPSRFRANVYISGPPAFAELEWEGRTIAIDGVPALRVMERIGRCVATEVDPQTGERDVVIPRMMLQAFGHKDCGVYAEPIAEVCLRPGGTLEILD